ncbi:MAG: FGGY-family carbohydrate kinase [Oscillospiraceae bacterium]
MRKYYLGIDGGTTGLRAGIYGSDGARIAFCSTAYPTRHDKPGFAEQSPEDWLTAMRKSISGAMESAKVRADEIIAMCTDTTSCSVLLCKRDGTPVRDCLIWMDVRAAKQSEYINRVTAEHLSPEWMPAKLMWLRDNEPQNYADAEIFCEYQDFLTYKLTGKWSININNAVNWGYNAELGGFSTSFYDKINMSDAISKFPADSVFAVGDAVGYVTEEAALSFGLDTGILVASGGIDSSIGILGMGICESGQLALITGSSNLAMLLTKKPLFNKDGVNSGPHHLIHGFYTDYRGQSSSGSAISWFKREFCRDLDSKTAYRTLDSEASGIPIGCEGLLVLDYFQGNRHPYLDGDVRAMIYGLSLSHTRSHVYRAFLEGVWFGTAHLLRQFAVAGCPVSEITVAGGFANSRLLLSILADICAIPVKIPGDLEAPCLGSAIAAAVAAKTYKDLPKAVRAMTKPAFTVLPNSENHAKYELLFAQYLKTYPELRDYFGECKEVFDSIAGEVIG